MVDEQFHPFQISYDASMQELQKTHDVLRSHISTTKTGFCVMLSLRVSWMSLHALGGRSLEEYMLPLMAQALSGAFRPV